MIVFYSVTKWCFRDLTDVTLNSEDIVDDDDYDDHAGHQGHDDHDDNDEHDDTMTSLKEL